MSKAYARALSYLTARNRTVKETADYLVRKGFSASEIQEAISRLQEVSLLNDTRTAMEWVDYCLACKPRGRDRLRVELLKRGLDRDVIEEALAKLDEEKEYELALQLLSPRPVAEWSREKLFRFLRYRGFSFPIIERVNLHYENLTQD